MLTATEVRAARRAVAAGARISQVARDLGEQYQTVRAAVRGLTWAHVRRPGPVEATQTPARSRRGQTGKLTARQLTTIRRAAADSVPLRELAQRYNVGADTISDAVYGVTWSHVTDPPPLPRRTPRDLSDAERHQLVTAAGEDALTELVCRLYQAGARQRDIGATLGVSRRQVARILVRDLD